MRSAFLSTCLLALAAGTCGCRTTVTDAPPGLDQSKPIVLSAQRVWRVESGGEIVGLIVRFGAADAPEDVTRHYYSVRNTLQQELGSIDGLGRAWKFELHESQPRFVGTGSVLDGARAILSLDGDANLIEARLESSAH